MNFFMNPGCNCCGCSAFDFVDFASTNYADSCVLRVTSGNLGCGDFSATKEWLFFFSSDDGTSLVFERSDPGDGRSGILWIDKSLLRCTLLELYGNGGDYYVYGDATAGGAGRLIQTDTNCGACNGVGTLSPLYITRAIDVSTTPSFSTTGFSGGACCTGCNRTWTSSSASSPNEFDGWRWTMSGSAGVVCSSQLYSMGCTNFGLTYAQFDAGNLCAGMTIFYAFGRTRNFGYFASTGARNPKTPYSSGDFAFDFDSAASACGSGSVSSVTW